MTRAIEPRDRFFAVSDKFQSDIYTDAHTEAVPETVPKMQFEAVDVLF
jgi:hypothetical protein